MLKLKRLAPGRYFLDASCQTLLGIALAIVLARSTTLPATIVDRVSLFVHYLLGVSWFSSRFGNQLTALTGC